PDHLDRYDYQIANYRASKFRLLRNQTKDDYFIYCLDDEETLKGLAEFKTEAQHLPFTQKQEVDQGAYLDAEKQIIIKVLNKDIVAKNMEELPLQVKHDAANDMAAGWIAKVQELRNQTMQERVVSYVNRGQCLQHVACIGGEKDINYLQDSSGNSLWHTL